MAKLSEKPYPFVFVVDYQYKGHLYFGVWDEKLQLYEFGDGDYHTTESVREMSDSVHFMGWPDVEKYLYEAVVKGERRYEQKSGAAGVYGQWPGTESDEEVIETLKEIE